MAWGLERIDARELTEWMQLFAIHAEEADSGHPSELPALDAGEDDGEYDVELEHDDVSDEELQAMVEAELARVARLQRGQK